MHLGTCTWDLHLEGCASLKEKRSRLKPLVVALRRVNLSVAEVDHQDLWQRATLGVAVVSGESRQIDELLQAVRNLVEGTFEAQLLDWEESRS